MKYIALFLFALVPLSASKLDRLDDRVDYNEQKLRDLYQDVQYLRDRIQSLEDQVYGTHEYYSEASSSETEELAGTSDDY